MDNVCKRDITFGLNAVGGQRYWSWIITASYNPGDRNTALSQSREQLLNHAEEERQIKEGPNAPTAALSLKLSLTLSHAFVFNNHALLSSLPDRNTFNFSKMLIYTSDTTLSWSQMFGGRFPQWQIHIPKDQQAILIKAKGQDKAV